MDRDRNLLAALLTRHLNYISDEQFKEICSLSTSGDAPDFVLEMVRKEWITPAESEYVLQLLGNKINEHGGSARKALGSIASLNDRGFVKDVETDELARTIIKPPSKDNFVQIETIKISPESRSRYSLTRVQGRGGLGQVWLARDTHLQREVALKEILPTREGEDETAQRFVREAQITGQLEHPNIIPVYELDQNKESGLPFYTMRFMRGQTLQERIIGYHDKRKHVGHDNLDFRRLLSAFVGICNAMAYAHSRGVIHRDLKPLNVMLGAFGEVIVLDWGLATLVDQVGTDIDMQAVTLDVDGEVFKTSAGDIVGTPSYMAPEQANGRRSKMDHRTDVYGLGGILFMILTGQPPHGANSGTDPRKSTVELLVAISEGETPLAKERAPWVPPALSKICEKAMSRSMAGRYATATDLASDVLMWLADDPVDVYKEPLFDRVWRRLKRNRTLALSIASVLLVVAVAGTVATVVISAAKERETAARKDAEVARDAEEMARQDATRRFREARSAVDRSLSEVSDLLAYFPRAQQARARLLEEAARDYERMANDRSDLPEIRETSGHAFYRLGDVRKSLGQIEPAEAAYRSGIAVFESLLQSKTNIQSEYSRVIADGRVRLATLFSEVDQRADEAVPEFTAAITSLQKLRDDQPDDDKAQESLAIAFLNQSRLLIRRGQLDAARAQLERAEQEFAKRADRTGTTNARKAHAEARHTIGQLLLTMGQSDSAAEALRVAVADYQRLVDETEDQPELLEGLAGSRMDLANTLVQLGRDSDAFEAYQKSVEDFDLLLKFRPGVPDFQANLAISHTNLAQILFRYGAPATAQQECEKGLRILNELIMLHASFGRYREAHAANTVVFGMILRDLNQDELALEALAGAAQEFQQLADDLPSIIDYRRRLAVTLTSLARTYAKVGQPGQATQYFGAAIRSLDELIEQHGDDPYSLDSLAWAELHYGTLLVDQKQPADAATHFVRAVSLRERLLKTEEASAEHKYSMAWLLTNCPSLDFRDVDRAFELADQARRLAQENPRYWALKSLAHYRKSDFTGCAESVAIARKLRPVPEPYDLFVLSMALWKQDNQKDARETLKQAQQMMNTERPGNLELLTLRAEAETLITVEE